MKSANCKSMRPHKQVSRLAQSQLQRLVRWRTAATASAAAASAAAAASSTATFIQLIDRVVTRSLHLNYVPNSRTVPAGPDPPSPAGDRLVTGWWPETAGRRLVNYSMRRCVCHTNNDKEGTNLKHYQIMNVILFKQGPACYYVDWTNWQINVHIYLKINT